MKEIVVRLRGKTFAEFYASSSGPKIMDARVRRASGFATIRERNYGGLLFHFCATYLKIQDLSEAEKMDRFVRTLVPDT